MSYGAKELPPDFHERHLALAVELERIAQELALLSRLDESSKRHDARFIPAEGPGRAAARLYADRRQRGRFFPASLFGEPAWDMLLDLFVHVERERPICVSSLCIASTNPATTALRHIQILQNAGLVQIGRDPSDARRRIATLTPAAAGAMRSYLVEIQQRNGSPAPVAPIEEVETLR